MWVLGVDPGYRESAYVLFDGTRIHRHAIVANDDLVKSFIDDEVEWDRRATTLVLEEMQIFSGHGVGKEVFDSVFWSGRFAQAWSPRPFERLIRARVRGYLGASKGGDAAVRAALIERFGPYKEDAIGKAKKPGPLFGIKSHEWSALAIAVVWHGLNGPQPTEAFPSCPPTP